MCERLRERERERQRQRQRASCLNRVPAALTIRSTSELPHRPRVAYTAPPYQIVPSKNLHTNLQVDRTSRNNARFVAFSSLLPKREGERERQTDRDRDRDRDRE